MNIPGIRLNLLWAMLALAAACTTSPEKTATQDQEPTPTPSVAWFRTTPTGAECMRTMLPEGTETIVATLDTIPNETVWDMSAKTVFFLAESGVYRKDFLSDKPAERIASLPEGIPTGSLYLGWIAGGNLRIVYSIPEWDFTEKLKETFARLSGGKSPSDMGGQLLLIYELDGNGSWKQVKELASGMSDGPGDPLMDVRKDIQPDSATASTRSIIASSACADAVVDNGSGWNMLEESQYGQYFPNMKAPESEGFYSVSINDHQDLIVSAMWGDLPHFCAPFFLYDRNAKKTEPFDPGTMLKPSAPIEQYGIQLSGNYLLLAREYDHDEVLILDKQTLKPVGKYRGASRAVLLP